MLILIQGSFYWPTLRSLSCNNISIIKNILKESKNINWDLIESSHLSQSKLYLKILGLSYSMKNTNNTITSNIILGVMKELHIFNNIFLALKLRIIKAFSYSVTNFIQLISSQPVDWFSQTKLHYKVLNKGYLHIYGMYKSDNKQLRYQVISNYRIFVC